MYCLPLNHNLRWQIVFKFSYYSGWICIHQRPAKFLPAEWLVSFWSSVRVRLKRIADAIDFAKVFKNCLTKLALAAKIGHQTETFPSRNSTKIVKKWLLHGRKSLQSTLKRTEQRYVAVVVFDKR